MIWNTNYQKLAASTLFTLFFAGKLYAPKCIINGIHVQDYLQNHYYNCFKKVATTIHENGLENTVVIGYDTMNEPGHGYLAVPDITQLSQDDTDFKMGLMPTAFQGMLLGSGIPTTVENWEFKWNGPKKSGHVDVDPQGTVAWLTQDEVNNTCTTFGWQRSASWNAGCIWALHGVWDTISHQVLQPNYFATQPNTEIKTDYMSHWIEYLVQYAESVRSVHVDAILFVQPPILAVPPKLPASLKRLVYAPHWYDGLTLVKKKWCNYNVDFINLNRGKYGFGPLRFVRALRLGEKSIRQCFVDQLETMKKEGLENIGEYPCILGEIGIPYDMEVSSASSVWDWCSSFFVKQNVAIGDPNSSQTRAMDASINALEKNLLNYSLWTYMPDNSSIWGDQWNGEDLSLWQQSFSDTEAKTYSDDDSSTLLTRTGNVRDIPSLHRPHPRVTSGIPLKIEFVSPSNAACASFEYVLKHEVLCEGPTEIYIPSCYFPPSSTLVEVSVGTWEIEQVNEAFWVLIWSIDTQGEAKLNLKGISFVSQ